MINSIPFFSICMASYGTFVGVIGKVEVEICLSWAEFQSKVTIKLQLYKTFLILCWEMLTITNTFTGQRRPDQIRKKLSSCPVLHPALRSDLPTTEISEMKTIYYFAAADTL